MTVEPASKKRLEAQMRKLLEEARELVQQGSARGLMIVVLTTDGTGYVPGVAVRSADTTRLTDAAAATCAMVAARAQRGKGEVQ